VVAIGWADVRSARAFTFPTEGRLSLGAGEAGVTVRLEPVGANFVVTESVLPSFRIWSPHMLYDQVEVNVAGVTVGLDVDRNGVGELALPFSRQQLRDLLKGVSSSGTDTLMVEGGLQGGRRVRGILSLAVHLLDIPRVTVAPNPARDHTNLSIKMDTSGYVSVRLFSPGGRLVGTPFRRAWVPAGILDLRVSLALSGADRLAAGVYFLQVETPAGSSSHKVVVVR
jgi:hypothetical protein